MKDERGSMPTDGGMRGGRLSGTGQRRGIEGEPLANHGEEAEIQPTDAADPSQQGDSVEETDLPVDASLDSQTASIAKRIDLEAWLRMSRPDLY